MRILWVVVCCAVFSSGAHGWPVPVGTRAPAKLAVDATDDVFAATPIRLSNLGITADVTKFDRVGHRRWRHRIQGTERPPSTDIGDLVLTNDGDAIFAGQVNDTDGTKFAV